MPGMTGLEVIQWSQENLDPVPPAIVLTSRADKSDIVHALEAGADDFIVKPETANVIVARVGAALRRSRLRKGSDFIARHGPYEFDKLASSVRLDGNSIALTAKEFGLIQLFFRNLNRPLSRSYIMQRVWGSVVDLPTRTLDMHVSRLRSKLELRPERGYGLQTVFGYGYRLDSLEEGEG
jgi:DNA-binding response OmpR family regulator